MADILYSVDVAIFYFLNNTISNSVLDKFFPFITEVKHWYIAYVILLGITFFKGGRKGKIAAIMALVLITASDQFSSTLLKNVVERIRPCNVLDNVNILVHCTGSYSFPSSHAVNNFAAAVFFATIFPRIKWVLLISAFIMALSRPYVGVHYPSDILVGAIIGSIFGYIFGFFVLYINDKMGKNGQVDDEESGDKNWIKQIKAEKYER